MKQRNLFIVGTPYQLITTLQLCDAVFGNNDQFENIVYVLKSQSIDYELPIKGTEINIDFHTFSPKEKVNLFKQLAKESFSNFFFFQENDVFNLYLASELKQRNCTICLGPDGAKPYSIYNKDHEFLSVLKDTYNDYKRLKVAGIKGKWFTARYYRYGSSSIIDQVWLSFPEMFDKKHNRTVASIKLIPPFTSDGMSKMMRTLSFQAKGLRSTDNVVLFFNQPFWSDALLNKELELLIGITRKFSMQEVYVKLHPATSEKTKSRFAELGNITLIDDKLPAEFYIHAVKNSKLITGWSTALMHATNEAGNTCYYLYPIYKQINDKVLNQLQMLDFPHIKKVNSINEIE